VPETYKELAPLRREKGDFMQGDKPQRIQVINE